MRLTIAMEATSASTVGTMIQPRLRASAEPSACRSMSPDSTCACFVTTGAGLASTLGLVLGFAIARSTTALSLPARQNAKRIEHSRRAMLRLYLNRGDYTPLRLLLG